MRRIVNQFFITALVLWEVIYAYLLLAGAVFPVKGFTYAHLVIHGLVAPAVIAVVVLLCLNYLLPDSDHSLPYRFEL